MRPWQFIHTPLSSPYLFFALHYYLLAPHRRPVRPRMCVVVRYTPPFGPQPYTRLLLHPFVFQLPGCFTYYFF